MEALIVTLLVILISLVILVIIKLGSKFVDFQANIHKAMDGARTEVERSKDVISGHAVETLKTIKDMGETIGRIVEQQKEAHALGNSLKHLLQMPKLRGNYGEEILEEMLERVVPKLWERQYSVAGGERVDAVVKYKDVVIPIDAKFPREIYEKYLSAEGPEEKKRTWRLYEDGLKIQINSISQKYIKPHEGTSDFALMFIPSESIYYETIAEKNHLGDPCVIYEFARKHKVIPVSPHTFYAFLQVVMLGVRNLSIIKSAKKLQEALIKIERNFNRFYSKYEDVGASIEKAQTAFKTGDAHIKRFKDTIDSTILLDLPDQPSLKDSTK